MAGIGFRIHFDSSAITFDSATANWGQFFGTVDEAFDDSDNYDGEDSTDKYVAIAFVTSNQSCLYAVVDCWTKTMLGLHRMIEVDKITGSVVAEMYFADPENRN